MSNDNTNPFERLFKLWAMVCKLVLDGKRDPVLVVDALQKIVDENPNLIIRVTRPDRNPVAPSGSCGYRSQAIRQQQCCLIKYFPLRGTGDEVKVVFFKLSRFISDNDSEKNMNRAASNLSICTLSPRSMKMTQPSPTTTRCYALERF